MTRNRYYSDPEKAYNRFSELSTEIAKLSKLRDDPNISDNELRDIERKMGKKEKEMDRLLKIIS